MHWTNRLSDYWANALGVSSAIKRLYFSGTCCGITFTGFASHRASSSSVSADVQGAPWSGTAVYRRSLPTSSRQRLRSATRGDLVVSSSATHFGARAFAVAGPKPWNQLPANSRALETVGPFKTALKTCLHSIQ